MAKMYNPETGETVEVEDSEVKGRESDGFVDVGDRPAGEYQGKTRDELTRKR
jgi:hypothetical protein